MRSQPVDLSKTFSPLLSNAKILVVDDEPGMRNFLVKTLAPYCSCVEEAKDTAQASALLDTKRFDIIILDNIMPGQSGIEWLAEQWEIGLFGDAILITAYAELETVIAALRAGAIDFLLKPFRSNQILNAVARCLDRAKLQRENNLLRHELDAHINILRRRKRLVGSSKEIETVRELLQRIAKLPANVIITGEYGTGKEVAARMLHDLSDRASLPFASISCSSGTKETFEEDLFGRVAQGADNQAQKEGLLLSAQGGTLFLDDVDELSSKAQIALIKVIETNKVKPFKADRDVPLNVRLVFSTSRSLRSLVEAGSFRKDLYYRINVLNVHIPPLRERPQDILDLVHLFLRKMKPDFKGESLEITPAIGAKLLRYDWPGNARELRNHVERAFINGDLALDLQLPPDAADIDTLAAIERKHILKTLEACKNNRPDAARKLGISRKTIDRKFRIWGL